LLAVVEDRFSNIIQFSHFSVKEFLISARLAEAKDAISRYHISMAPAHALVGQACLGILLHLDETITRDGLENFPLAQYAAKHWTDHVRFRDVSASMQDGIKDLFDPRKRHFDIWIWIYHPHSSSGLFQRSTYSSQPRGSSLYYAALLGIHEVITFLAIECSQDLNDSGLDYNETPLNVTIRHGHMESARVLLEHGADVNAQGRSESTPLHYALNGGHVAFARVLLEHGADVNAQDYNKSTPLYTRWKADTWNLLRFSSSTELM
jgi:hypothetical protein